jgi:hypothetical protein
MGRLVRQQQATRLLRAAPTRRVRANERDNTHHSIKNAFSFPGAVQSVATESLVIGLVTTCSTDRRGDRRYHTAQSEYLRQLGTL